MSSITKHQKQGPDSCSLCEKIVVYTKYPDCSASRAQEHALSGRSRSTNSAKNDFEDDMVSRELEEAFRDISAAQKAQRNKECQCDCIEICDNEYEHKNGRGGSEYGSENLKRGSNESQMLGSEYERGRQGTQIERGRRGIEIENERQSTDTEGGRRGTVYNPECVRRTRDCENKCRKQGQDCQYESSRRGTDYESERRDTEYDRGRRDIEYESGGRGSEYENDKRGSEYEHGKRGSEYEDGKRGSEYVNGRRGTEYQSESSRRGTVYNPECVRRTRDCQDKCRKQGQDCQYESSRRGTDYESSRRGTDYESSRRGTYYDSERRDTENDIGRRGVEFESGSRSSNYDSRGRGSYYENDRRSTGYNPHHHDKPRTVDRGVPSLRSDAFTMTSGDAYVSEGRKFHDSSTQIEEDLCHADGCCCCDCNNTTTVTVIAARPTRQCSNTASVSNRSPRSNPRYGDGADIRTIRTSHGNIQSTIPRKSNVRNMEHSDQHQGRNSVDLGVNNGSRRSSLQHGLRNIDYYDGSNEPVAATQRNSQRSNVIYDETNAPRQTQNQGMRNIVIDDERHAPVRDSLKQYTAPDNGNYGEIDPQLTPLGQHVMESDELSNVDTYNQDLSNADAGVNQHSNAHEENTTSNMIFKRSNSPVMSRKASSNLQPLKPHSSSIRNINVYGVNPNPNSNPPPENAKPSAIRNISLHDDHYPAAVVSQHSGMRNSSLARGNHPGRSLRSNRKPTMVNRAPTHISEEPEYESSIRPPVSIPEECCDQEPVCCRDNEVICKIIIASTPNTCVQTCEPVARDEVTTGSGGWDR